MQMRKMIENNMNILGENCWKGWSQSRDVDFVL